MSTESSNVHDKQTADRGQIDAIRFVALCSIAFFHAPYFLHDTFLYSYLSGVLTSARLPLVFLISGFFLLKKDVICKAVYFEEMKKRLRTLVVPFLFWNLAILIAIEGVKVVIPSGVADSAYLVRGEGFRVYFDAVLGIGRKPIHYQFWFLRDLFLVCLISPVFRFFIVKSPYVGILLAFLVEQYIAGVSFFFVGGLIAYFWSRSILTPMSSGWVFAASLVGGLCYYFMGLESWVFKFCISVSFLLSLSDLLLKTFPTGFGKLSHLSFMVFALHEPLITLFAKAFKSVLMQIPNGLIYIVLPSATILTCLLIATVLKSWAPWLYNLSTGSR